MLQSRLVIVSPFRLYREALAGVLRDQREFEVIDALAGLSEGGSSAAAAEAVLVDARLIRNRSAVTELRSRYPGAWIIAASIIGNDREALRCTRSGVDGIISQDPSGAEISDVLSRIRQRGFPGPEELAGALFSYVAGNRVYRVQTHARLTRRERKVASLAARGLSNKGIAQELKLEVATVKNNMHNILRKCGLSRRSELAARLKHQSGL